MLINIQFNKPVALGDLGTVTGWDLKHDTLKPFTKPPIERANGDVVFELAPGRLGQRIVTVYAVNIAYKMHAVEEAPKVKAEHVPAKAKA